MKKSGKLTQQAVKSLYPNHTSFIDFLPWVEYLPNSQCLLLDDGVSVGAVLKRSLWVQKAEQKQD